MNTRGSVVVLPLVPSPKKIKFQSELHAILSYYIQRELRHVSTPYHLTQSVQMLGAPAPYQPKQKPSRLSWLLPMPSVIRSHSGNCVLRRSGRSLVNKRDADPWSVHPSPYIMPYSTRTDASRASK